MRILVTPTFERAVKKLHAQQKASLDEAVRTGMRSLRHDALEKFVQGRIDLRQARIAYV